jgi:hypothetical protein
MTDIFEFWSRIKRGEQVHPADKEVFDRMDPERHGFELDCLPACFAGRLKTASVILLYLSPGYDQTAADDAKTEEARFNNGYGNISPKNFFKGGQETSLNNLVYLTACDGKRITLWFFRTADYKITEAALRASLKLAWNRI